MARVNVRISEYPSAKAFLFAYEEKKCCDILLADIEMDGINGVEMAERVRLEDDSIQIVFITGYPDYMSRGYDVSALHYLLKPLSEEKLSEVLDRAMKNIERKGRRLILSTDEGDWATPLDISNEDPLRTEPANETAPRRSVVPVYFASRDMTLAYYNDRFDLHRGDTVYVDGKLEGHLGRVTEVNYNFKIKLSYYKRVIGVADTNVHGRFFAAGSHFVTFDRAALPTMNTSAAMTTHLFRLTILKK